MVFGASVNLRRQLKPGEVAKVNFVELFFDLVFVFALTQVSHFLLYELDGTGLLRATVLFVGMWWVWVDTAWMTNWLDPARAPVRLVLFALMLGCLLLSTSLPQSFAELGLLFALAHVAVQVGRSAFAYWAGRRHHPVLGPTYLRLVVWLGLAGILWIAGGIAGSEARLILWGIAIAIETIAAAVGYWTPGLGAAKTLDWQIDGDHMAERCGLFVIIALGETILVAGATFAGHDWNAAAIAAFVSVFTTTVALWWIYFGFGAGVARHRIAGSDDPGRLARSAYTYVHMAIIGGIVTTAVANELILAHPTGAHAEPALVLALIGGTVLYVSGVMLFRWTIFRRIPVPYALGLVALVALGLLGGSMAPLVLSAFTAIILAVTAAIEFAISRSTAMTHSAE